ncbi:MAG TPA: hypothetical protein VMU16_11805 [Candidatus Binataceae bacterium]|nr:hypothetical protein [Candidatus Binataceae bacterium]
MVRLLQFAISIPLRAVVVSLALMSLPIGLAAVPAQAQICPYVVPNSIVARNPIKGKNSNHRMNSSSSSDNCSVIITVTDSGATVASTDVLPYDSLYSPCAGPGCPGPTILEQMGDDILVGVVNNSSLPVGGLGLDTNGGNAIFSFNGDGVNGFQGIANNSKDKSNGGYGGPNAYFPNINSSTTGGVAFITPIQPHGGTGYFSLASQLNTATPCGQLIHPFNSTLSGPFASGSMITASFTPLSNASTLGISGTPSTLLDAATVCSFDNFDWQQTIEHWPYPSSLLSASFAPLWAGFFPQFSPPFPDPPPGGYN